uniref:WH2 domain-containing protein n=1 Tax=Panagrolaimus davidi TaxID=227884 RepID=A0A914QK57_9BILA
MSTTTVPPPPPPPPPPPADFFKITNVPAEVHSNERNNLMKDIQSGIKLKSIPGKSKTPEHVPPNETISKLPDSGVNTVENVSSQPPPLPSSPYPSEPSQTAYTVKIIPSQIQETTHSTGLLPSQNLATNGTLQIIKPSILPKPKIFPNDGINIEKKESELSKNLNVSEQLTPVNANISPSQSTSTLTSQPQPQQPVRNAAEAMKYLMDNKFKDHINQRRSRVGPTSDDEKNKSGENSSDNEK